MTDLLVVETSVAAPVVIPGGRVVSVKRGFGWCLAGYAVYMFCQWAMMVALTRLGSPDLKEVALFALAIAATTPIILFSNLGLRRVYASDSKSVFQFADYFTLRMATNVAALALIAGVTWARGYPAEIVWATIAMGAAKVIESTSDILHGYFQHRGPDRRGGPRDDDARSPFAGGIPGGLPGHGERPRGDRRHGRGMGGGPRVL
jgi:hypothetical protein